MAPPATAVSRTCGESTLTAPIGTYSYTRAYKTACAKAGVDYRLYDARHTFVTPLAEKKPFASLPAT